MYTNEICVWIVRSCIIPQLGGGGVVKTSSGKILHYFTLRLISVHIFLELADLPKVYIVEIAPIPALTLTEIEKL